MAQKLRRPTLEPLRSKSKYVAKLHIHLPTGDLSHDILCIKGGLNYLLLSTSTAPSTSLDLGLVLSSPSSAANGGRVKVRVPHHSAVASREPRRETERNRLGMKTGVWSRKRFNGTQTTSKEETKVLQGCLWGTSVCVSKKLSSSDIRFESFARQVRTWVKPAGYWTQPS